MKEAELLYKYASMKAGKSLELLKTADSYERTGKKVILLTPSTDYRDGVGRISSRIGISRDAYPIDDLTLLAPLCAGADVVLIDEAQFLSAVTVKRLAKFIVDKMNIDVIAFGLKNTFKNELFEGSAALLIYADRSEEITGVCELCNRNATMVVRTVDGEPVYEGDTIQIGDSEYVSVCRRHYFNFPRGSKDGETNH